MFFETSAKTAQNVKKMFEEVCNQLLLHSLRRSRAEDGKGNTFRLRAEEEGSHSFCC